MANRVPLVIDLASGSKISELKVGDNLDLTSNNLVGVGDINTNRLFIRGTEWDFNYSRLTNTPTIPRDLSELTDNTGILDNVGSGSGGSATLRVAGDDSTTIVVGGSNTLQFKGTGAVSTRIVEEAGTDVVEIFSPAVTDTTYTLFTETDPQNNSDVFVRLNSSQGTNQNIKLVSGTNVSIQEISTNELRISATDTDTTYNISTDVDNQQVVLRLQSVGGATDDVKFVAGNNVSISQSNNDTITIDNTQTLPNTFGQIVIGSTILSADQVADDLNIQAGSGISVSGNTGSNSITISNTQPEQNIFQTVVADTGSRTAQSTTESLSIVGGASISTTITNNVLTIDYTGSAGGSSNTFNGVAVGTPLSNTQLVADDPNDVLYIAGGTGINITATGAGAGDTVDQITIVNSAPNIDQNLFATIAGDSGSTQANSTTDTLNILGGTGITTTVVGDTLTINASSTGTVNFNQADNYAYKTFAVSTGGSTTASSSVDTLTFQPDSGISITAFNDTITITNTSPNVDQNIFYTFVAGGQNIQPDSTSDSLHFLTGNGISIGGNPTNDSITITNTAPNVDQNLFGSIAVAGQTSITPNSTNTALEFVPGSGVSLTLNNTNKTITVNNTLPNVDQNIFSTVAVSGQTDILASSINDTLTVQQGSGIEVTTSGNTLTITNTAQGAVQNAFSSVAVAGQNTISAANSTDTFNVAAGTNITVTTDSVTNTLTINSTASGGGTPGGSNTQVQFNDGGAFGGDTTFTFNKTTDTLFVKNIEAETVQAPNTLVGTYTISSPTTITLDPVDEIINDAPMKLVNKTVTELGTLVSSVGAMVFCTDESGGAIPAFYDGTNWRRVSDRSIVS